MARKPTVDLLSRIWKIQPEADDFVGAKGGSVRDCFIAKGIRRTCQGKATHVAVRYNGITVTYNGYIHHFAIPTAALDIAMKNDLGEFDRSMLRPLTFKQIDNPVKAPTARALEGRQPKVNAARTARNEAIKKAGGKPKVYRQNPRQAVFKANRALQSSATA